MTYAMLYQILAEAEARVNGNWPADVKQRSQETVDLVLQRIAMEGLTRAELKKLARADRKAA